MAVRKSRVGASRTRAVNEAVERGRLALAESERQYHALFENMAAGFVLFEAVLDEHGAPVDLVVLAANKGFERTTGLSRDAAIGQRLTHLLPQLATDGADWMGVYGRIALSGVSRRFVQYSEFLDAVFAISAYQSAPGRCAVIFVDITEQRRMEEALGRQGADLRASEERFRLAQDLSPDGFTILHPVRDAHEEIVDFTWVYENQAVARLNGTDPAQVIGKRLLELFPEHRGTALYEAYVRAASAGERAVFDEVNVGMIVGRLTWLRIVVVPMGEDIAILAEDITDRKQAEQALAESEARLRLALRATNQGLYDLNLQTGEAIVSPEYASMLDFDPETFVETTAAWIARLHPDDRAVATQAYLDYVSGKTSEYRVEYRQRTRDLGWKWILSLGKIVEFAPDGTPLRMLGTHTDITARKQLELDREKFIQLADSSFEFIGMCDLEMRPIYVNPAGQRMVGLPDLRAACQVHVTDYFFPEDQGFIRDQFFPRVLRDGQGDVEIRLRHFETGEPVWVSYYLFSVRDSFGNNVGWATVSRDISERKRFEAERTGMEAQLRQRQKLEAIGTLASGVAHEINNPLTGILNYAHLIHDQLPLESRLREFAGEIMHESERVAGIVHNLLTFSRNEKQSHSPARIADIVEATLSMIRTVIRRDQITLTATVPDDLPLVKCRSQQIQQVLMNLMTNARDALNQRYPGHDPDKVLQLAARGFEAEGRRWVRLTVEDHGVGITPEVRERMFDPFYTTKPREVGTGLGLAISHGIVHEHHGEITVDSEPGRYTRIHVDLPVDNGWTLHTEPR